jgi:DNA-binding XRE family transcriptional regulator
MRMADYRRTAGLTQEGLARLALVARSSISLVEGGRQRPSVRFAHKICRALSAACGSPLAVWDVFPGEFNRVELELRTGDGRA